MARILEATDAAIKEAAATLRAGAVVAFPTETVYGLGAAARNPEAVDLIYRLKGRPRGHPLIVHLPSIDQLAEWAVGNATAMRLVERFWPGPLTLVLPRQPGVPDAVTGGQETVALRMPAHPVALALLKEFGDAVAAPSANRFGRISPTAAAHVAAEFPAAEFPAAEFPEGLLVLDAGPSEVGLESTILDLTGVTAGTPPRLLRPGGVPLSAIEECLGQAVERPGHRAGGSEGGAAPAPGSRDRAGGAPIPRVSGSLTSHYAARALTLLVAPEEVAVRALLEGDSAAVLALQPRPQDFRGRWLRLPSDPVAYGQRLYAALRELDGGEPSVILIEDVPYGAAWLAVRDRLTRAAAR